MRSILIQLLPLLACSTFVAADAFTVVNDFNNINSILQTLDNDVNQLQSGVLGISQALTVSSDALSVDNALNQANSDVQASSTFSASDSTNIINAVSNVATTANKSLTDLTNKASAIGGLAPVVLASLYQLKNDQNSLGVSLYSKLDQSQVNRGIQLLGGLNVAFNAAIQTYAAL